MFSGTEIMWIVGAAVLLFGADKLPKLARSMGQAKKEFAVGQAEADIEAERVRTELRAKAEAAATTTREPGAAVTTPSGVGEPIPPPVAGSGTTPTGVAPEQPRS
jgi:sec-independent protein translocase protein TatA